MRTDASSGVGPGFMTTKIRTKYLDREIASGTLPPESHRVPKIVSLTYDKKSMTKDMSDPLYFWQLYSVLGPDPIVSIVRNFYQRVFADETTWFREAFTSLAPLEHHVVTQASMWIDCMGGGKDCYYHGGEGRLHFHHAHNAPQVMTREGALRWTEHMVHTLDDHDTLLASYHPEARMAINSFLEFFMDYYAKQFQFSTHTRHDTSLSFEPRTPSISLRQKNKEELQQLPMNRLLLGLAAEGIDTAGCLDKETLVDKALNLSER